MENVVCNTCYSRSKSYKIFTCSPMFKHFRKGYLHICPHKIAEIVNVSIKIIFKSSQNSNKTCKFICSIVCKRKLDFVQSGNHCVTLNIAQFLNLVRQIEDIKAYVVKSSNCLINSFNCQINNSAFQKELISIGIILLSFFVRLYSCVNHFMHKLLVVIRLVIFFSSVCGIGRNCKNIDCHYQSQHQN